ncbi:hypothetical protein ACN42_g6767 [Penicillium freii]|uniref:Uncharacterized protein n=1 Tax=Penicillium freii TaxID=48697 RepID=A0A101MGX7_PENFR|nr:hypothetical protein ACN42_g6767 [Penicillium freii]
MAAKRRLTQQVADLTGAPGVKLTARSSSFNHYSPSSSLIIYLLVTFFYLSLIPQTWRFFWVSPARTSSFLLHPRPQ